MIIQEFQYARGYSPVLTGLRLMPFFATPMFISPLAGIELTLALLIAGFRPALWTSW
jgi:hypothetical protein